MARPQKSGLEYFPLDVDIDQDDKVALIEAQHGLVGFGIVIKLLMKIYKHNYFYEWTEKEQLLFSRKVNVDINSIDVIINDCVKWGLFDENMFEILHILTSHGIQKRYLEASGRRQRVEIDEKYLLLDDETVNVYRNLVIVNINPHSVVVNEDINPQSKVKESKVKNSKVKESKIEEIKVDKSSSDDAIELCKYYSILKPGQIITQHLGELNVFIQDYKFDWCKEALQKTVLGTGKFVPNYMLKILKGWSIDGKPEYKKADKFKGTFNDFEQRDYDYEKLENKLENLDDTELSGEEILKQIRKGSK